MKYVRWFLLIPVFSIVNTLIQYLYMELVDLFLGTRIAIGGKTFWLFSSVHHILLFFGYPIILVINNLALAIAPNIKKGVIICFLLYLIGIILRYIYFDINFSWFEFYYWQGIIATLHSFFYMYSLNVNKFK